MPRTFLEAPELKTNNNNPDYTGLFSFLDVLNNEPDATFPQEIEKVLDVDEALRFLAVSAGIVHLDNYIGIGHNMYLYEVDGKFTVIPWDLNMTFGTFNGGIRKRASSTTTSTSRPPARWTGSRSPTDCCLTRRTWKSITATSRNF